MREVDKQKNVDRRAKRWKSHIVGVGFWKLKMDDLRFLQPGARVAKLHEAVIWRLEG